MKITTYPIVVSASLLGFVALFISLFYAVFVGDSLLHSDNPYLIGFAASCVTSLSLLIYLYLREINIRWLNSGYVITLYYVTLTAYLLALEYIGGETAGIGFFFLMLLACSLPPLVFVIFSKDVRPYLKYGFICGLIYVLAFSFVMLSHM